MKRKAHGSDNQISKPCAFKTYLSSHTTNGSVISFVDQIWLFAFQPESADVVQRCLLRRFICESYGCGGLSFPAQTYTLPIRLRAAWAQASKLDALPPVCGSINSDPWCGTIKCLKVCPVAKWSGQFGYVQSPGSNVWDICKSKQSALGSLPNKTLFPLHNEKMLLAHTRLL